MKRYPNALAILALEQLTRLEITNVKRSAIVKKYLEELPSMNVDLPIMTVHPLLRFPVIVSDKIAMKKAFAEQGIYIGDWYTKSIDPHDTDLTAVAYTWCKVSERTSSHIINLPTYPTLTDNDIVKILSVMKQIVK
jgi:dTDP-4-amino-4,6-dideoxygalactose transaminase